MSMPEFPKLDSDFTQEQALTMILSSIASEELALSHIIEAEGEKIQYILNQCNCHDSDRLKDILAVNKSVTNLLEMVLQNQMILKNKMEKVLEFIPKPPHPICPIEPSCLPMPSCLKQTKCCTAKQCCCFSIIPNYYPCNEALQWSENCICDCFKFWQKDCSKIQMPCTGIFALDVYLDTGNLICSPGDLKLIVCCKGKKTIVKTLHLERHPNNCSFHKQLFIKIPCYYYPCYISSFVCASCGMHVRQGRIVFTKI